MGVIPILVFRCMLRWWDWLHTNICVFKLRRHKKCPGLKCGNGKFQFKNCPLRPNTSNLQPGVFVQRRPMLYSPHIDRLELTPLESSTYIYYELWQCRGKTQHEYTSFSQFYGPLGRRLATGLYSKGFTDSQNFEASTRFPLLPHVTVMTSKCKSIYNGHWSHGVFVLNCHNESSLKVQLNICIQ